MNAAVLSPIESEFASAEEAAAYDRWFRAQVQESIADPRSSIPHDQAMAEMRAIIAAKKKKRSFGLSMPRPSCRGIPACIAPAVSPARGKTWRIRTT